MYRTTRFLCLVAVATGALVPTVKPSNKRRTASVEDKAAASSILKKWGLVDETGRDVSRAGPVLSVYDTKTRSRAIIVGTMHFNPVSVELARDVVRAEAVRGRVLQGLDPGSVC